MQFFKEFIFHIRGILWSSNTCGLSNYTTPNKLNNVNSQFIQLGATFLIKHFKNYSKFLQIKVKQFLQKYEV